MTGRAHDPPGVINKEKRVSQKAPSMGLILIMGFSPISGGLLVAKLLAILLEVLNKEKALQR